jgi:predicted aspartyl protease
VLRYRYSDEFVTPAPFVHLFLANPSDGTTTEAFPAQIDSGADRSVIPSALIEQLHLQPMRKLPVAGLGSDVQHLDTYFVAAQIRGAKPRSLEVIAVDHEPFVLLGRDLLNEFRITLDGPNRMLEIDD